MIGSIVILCLVVLFVGIGQPWIALSIVVVDRALSWLQDRGR